MDTYESSSKSVFGNSKREHGEIQSSQKILLKRHRANSLDAMAFRFLNDKLLGFLYSVLGVLLQVCFEDIQLFHYFLLPCAGHATGAALQVVLLYSDSIK